MKIVSTQTATLIDSADGFIDASRVYPEIHAAPSENRAPMLRDMLLGQKSVPKGFRAKRASFHPAYTLHEYVENRRVFSISAIYILS